MEEKWEPLEARLGCARCGGFMFMGRVDGIYQYKHGISRRYLFLDDQGRAYEAAGRNGFREIPLEEAITRVVAPLLAMGEALETAYDSAYIRRKDAALRKVGIKVLRVRIAPEDGTV